jgi:ribosomal protein S18 acetylase RimI-like enzyme
MGSDPDSPRAVRMAVANDMSSVGMIAQETGLFPAEMAAELFDGCREKPREALFLVAAGPRSVLGFAYGERERLTTATWNVRAIAVTPTSQRTGVARELLREVENAIVGLGGRVVIIETSDDDDQRPACRFYEMAGYAREARIRDFWNEGVAKLIFWKRL